MVLKCLSTKKSLSKHEFAKSVIIGNKYFTLTVGKAYVDVCYHLRFILFFSYAHIQVLSTEIK